MIRLGVVSFMNSRPLIEGLAQRVDVRLTFDVPARLADRLTAGEFDAALLPIVDVLRSNGRFEIVSDACIGCDGETMTVRVFSQTPPHKVHTLWVDGDSHTSVALARLLWRELYGISLDLRPLTAGIAEAHEHDAVLLIGDKVIDPRRGSFAYEVDLGGAWRQHTGLPFVFAVWAAVRSGEWRVASRECKQAARLDENSGSESSFATRHSPFEILAQARDLGVARAAQIADEAAAAHGWPPALAARYLTRCLCYKVDTRMVEGASLFAQRCAQLDLVPADAELRWPPQLARTCATV